VLHHIIVIEQQILLVGNTTAYIIYASISERNTNTLNHHILLGTVWGVGAWYLISMYCLSDNFISPKNTLERNNFINHRGRTVGPKSRGKIVLK